MSFQKHQHVFVVLLAILPIVMLQVTSSSLRLGIRDLTVGSGIPNVTIEVYRGTSDTNQWNSIATVTTNARGSADVTEDFSVGEYRILFYAKPYYDSKNLTTFYPYIEVHIKHTNENEDVVVPVLSSPYGYSLYKGSIS